MSKEYPLYPELKEQAKLEAEALIVLFKEKMRNACEEVLGQVYTDIVPHIESDSWVNFRNDLLAGFQDYRHSKSHADYDFKRIREKIFSEYRAEIIADLNQDLLKKIEEQNKEISRLLEWQDSRFSF